MNEFDNLTEENYILYAAKQYIVPIYIYSEFENDLKTIKYIKRLFRKYKNKGDLRERLILNHIICLYNVFGPEASTRLLFLKIDKKDYDLLKTCLLYLNYMPDVVYGIRGENIIADTIELHKGMQDALSEI